MRGPAFDDAIERLARGAGSRRRALVLAAAALAPAALTPSLPTTAHSSRQKQRCKKRGGAYLTNGQCHCAMSCKTPATVELHCHGDQSCWCEETVDGKGYCGLLGTFTVCVSDDDCPAGEICIIERGCTDCAGPCTTVADCVSGCACLRGTCQTTLCAAP
jgi:hypothetical protein